MNNFGLIKFLIFSLFSRHLGLDRVLPPADPAPIMTTSIFSVADADTTDVNDAFQRINVARIPEKAGLKMEIMLFRLLLGSLSFCSGDEIIH